MTFDQFKSRWSGVVAGHRVFDVALQLDAVLESQSDSRGGSLPFMGLASDGEVYWIKSPSNRQSSRVPTTEQLVAGMGRLIGAPVCETKLLTISRDFDGETLDNGTVLDAGIAHASRDVGNCSFDKWSEPQYRAQDDNRRRHAGYFALFDWCWGDDMQWLYRRDCQSRSHDPRCLAPDAKFADGEFDALHVGKLGRLGLLRYFPRLISGRIPTNNPAIRATRCRSFKISDSSEPLTAHLDGEMFVTPADDCRYLRVTLIPKRLQVLLM